MSQILQKIRMKNLHSRVMAPEETIRFFKDGMVLGLSGFGPSGDPKVIPAVLADYVEQNGLQGKLRFTLLSGASIKADNESRWAALGMTAQRWPYQNSKISQNHINRGAVRMGDKHLSMFAQGLGYGFYAKEKHGRIDLAVVEATAITEEGNIVLSTGVGATPEIVQVAEKIIVELNTALPSFEGLHDIVMPDRPPGKKPHLIGRVDDRIGNTFVPCDPGKIVAIVESTELDKGNPRRPPDDISEQIAANVIDFFSSEIKAGRLPKNLLPLESGSGNIANAVICGLNNGPFSNLTVWTEVLQDSMLDLFDSGKLDFASCTSLLLTGDGFDRLYGNWREYSKRVILRPVQITNHPELVRRLGVIAMNTPLEFDIYAHANSTLIGGTRMVNGIGGAGEFARNAYLSIMHCPSTRPTKSDPHGITCVVPMAPHVDISEHDLDVLVTEQGVADLRGLCPTDRAQVVIDNCAHPEYRPILQEYLDRATKECRARAAGHEPHMLFKVFKMQQHLAEHGTMKIDNWN